MNMGVDETPRLLKYAISHPQCLVPGRRKMLQKEPTEVQRTRKVLAASFPQNPQVKRSNFFHCSACHLDLSFLPSLAYGMTPNKCPWASQPCQELSTTAHQREGVQCGRHGICLQPSIVPSWTSGVQENGGKNRHQENPQIYF